MSVTKEKAEVAVTRAQPAAAGMLDVAAQREVAEIQGAMMMAKRFPRDHIAATDRIGIMCTRAELAEVALYSYARGGTEITGPSIRLAEALAQCWGNLQFGIRELEQRAGESVVEAFAIDLETNTRQNKIFTVPHVRFTRDGGRRSLDDPRDVYEQVANQGARRLRACILGIIPGDVIDTAVRQVELTLRTKQEITPERLKDLVAKFGVFKVTQEMIEKRIQRRLDAITPALLVQLGKIHNSLRDGMSAPGDWFELQAEEPATGSKSEQIKKKLAPAAEKKDDAPEQRDIIPHFDKTSAIAAIKNCGSVSQLDEVWSGIVKDFRDTDRELPLDVEATFNDRREALRQKKS